VDEVAAAIAGGTAPDVESFARTRRAQAGAAGIAERGAAAVAERRAIVVDPSDRSVAVAAVAAGHDRRKGDQAGTNG
jgi:hypothetical protein